MNIGTCERVEPTEPTIRVILDKNAAILSNIEDGVKAIGYAMYGDDKFLRDEKKQSDIPGSFQSELMKLGEKLIYIDGLIEEIVRRLA